MCQTLIALLAGLLVVDQHAKPCNMQQQLAQDPITRCAGQSMGCKPSQCGVGGRAGPEARRLRVRRAFIVALGSYQQAHGQPRTYVLDGAET